jgi:hypothetical protein
MALGDVYKEEMRFVQARTAALLRKHVLGGAIAGGERQGPELCSARGRISPSHGENMGSSPLGSAMSFGYSFSFKALVACLCRWDAVFV